MPRIEFKLIKSPSDIVIAWDLINFFKFFGTVFGQDTLKPVILKEFSGSKVGLYRVGRFAIQKSLFSTMIMVASMLVLTKMRAPCMR